MMTSHLLKWLNLTLMLLLLLTQWGLRLDMKFRILSDKGRMNLEHRLTIHYVEWAGSLKRKKLLSILTTLTLFKEDNRVAVLCTSRSCKNS